MEGETKKAFEVVKEFLVSNFPEFNNTTLESCPTADEYYEESKIEQEKEKKLPRVYAHTLHKENVVCYTEKMDTDLSDEQRIGIMIHEFGHLLIENHPYDFTDEDTGEVQNDDMNADIVCYEMFGVEIHYDDNDIEYVNLPLGCDVIEQIDESDEESNIDKSEDMLEPEEKNEPEIETEIKPGVELKTDQNIEEELKNDGEGGKKD
jgi:hypothetical protein